MHEHTIRFIAKYLASTSTYADLPYGNIWLSTLVVDDRPINKKASNVTWMTNSPVVGLKQIPIMQKISCCDHDM